MAIDKNKINLQSKWLIFAIIVLGFGLRLLASTLGHNYDFDSYLIVADIVDHGKNVYANTTRYNYGPVWFYLLNFTNLLAAKDQSTFRYLLVLFLSFVDLGILFILWQKINKTVACLFFLNPITIIITGYHNQFDNLAILIGMVSLTFIGDSFDKSINKKGILGLSILGLSLATKHVLFAFPIWLAIKQKGISQKLIILTIPIIVFFLSFVPYLNEGYKGIFQNVFFYRSWDNEIFYRLFIPKSIQVIFTSYMLWIFLLVIFGFYFRRKKSFESLLLYTAVLVFASPSIANQYLAIPIPFVSANFNPFMLSYTVFGTFFLLIESYSFASPLLQDLAKLNINLYYIILIPLLFLGFVVAVWPQQLRKMLTRILLEVKVQLGLQEDD